MRLTVVVALLAALLGGASAASASASPTTRAGAAAHAAAAPARVVGGSGSRSRSGGFSQVSKHSGWGHSSRRRPRHVYRPHSRGGYHDRHHRPSLLSRVLGPLVILALVVLVVFFLFRYKRRHR